MIYIERNKNGGGACECECECERLNWSWWWRRWGNKTCLYSSNMQQYIHNIILYIYREREKKKKKLYYIHVHVRREGRGNKKWQIKNRWSKQRKGGFVWWTKHEMREVGEVQGILKTKGCLYLPGNWGGFCLILPTNYLT